MKTSKLLRDTDNVYVPITMTVAMRRFALAQSKEMDGCGRKNEGSISHFYRTIAQQYARKLFGKEVAGITS